MTRTFSAGPPGGDKVLSELHIYACGLLALAFNDKDESTTKDIASLEAMARKAGYKGVPSMIIQNSSRSYYQNVLAKVRWQLLREFPYPGFTRSSILTPMSSPPLGSTIRPYG
eukprot:CAMPEP_0170965046 /NCGR_PEP_ID=MMETSP0735-20130129/40714_1 /TAXON_ID=186038 /ORGANISM="Fragilariopsis kerguelensis, Strain L26-C5" /LENGTH=112 /DNA_ID=CAMNT_0011382379 /DNA_START=213 /DNA_END=551 /DNA_ORIENTATION=+